MGVVKDPNVWMSSLWAMIGSYITCHIAYKTNYTPGSLLSTAEVKLERQKPAADGCDHLYFSTLHNLAARIVGQLYLKSVPLVRHDQKILAPIRRVVAILPTRLMGVYIAVSVHAFSFKQVGLPQHRVHGMCCKNQQQCFTPQSAIWVSVRKLSTLVIRYREK